MMICCCFLLAGCQLRERQHYLSFVPDEEIEYSDDFNSCSLIESADGYKKEQFEVVEEDKIKLPNGKTIMCNTEKKQPTLDTVKYTFSYRNQEEVKRIRFIDTMKPEFTSIKEEYIVQKDNEYFKLNSIIEVKDNYDKKLELFFNGKYDVSKTGTYEIEVVAEDSSKNRASEKVRVIVKSSLTDDEQKDSPSSSNQASSSDGKVHNGSASSGSSNNSTTVPQAPEQTPIQSSKSPKTFSIDDYSSFEECLNACNLYIIGSNGLCSPYQEDGINKGYRATFQ